MKEIDHINVYLANSSKAIQKHDGVVISILECVFADGEKVAGKAKEVPYKGMSYIESETFGLVQAMERMRYPAKLEVYTDCKWLSNVLSRNLSTWREAGWKTSAGKPCMEEVKRIGEYEEKLPFRIHDGGHEFTTWLETRCRQIRERKQW